MTIIERPDGRIALDWKPPNGPYITITKAQWTELLHALSAAKGPNYPG
jgi:hypothetical protein